MISFHVPPPDSVGSERERLGRETRRGRRVSDFFFLPISRGGLVEAYKCKGVMLVID